MARGRESRLSSGPFFLDISAQGIIAFMAQQRIFPFRRVSVDHMVRGVTRVWWQLEPLFRDPPPYEFQLQFGRSGIRDANDWVNVGDPVINTYFAGDPDWREGGYTLLSHYRVKLTTANGVYISQPANCFGDLSERDWLLAREIIRKEKLRHRLVSVPGYLAKPLRYGPPCKRCRDQLTQEVTDANCPVCNGTGFEVGYHPVLPMQCWDLSPQIIQEDVDTNMKGATREQAYVDARVIGFPALNKYDIWINGTSDERWMVETIQVAAAIRNVPIVYQVKLGLLPFSNMAYSLEIGGEPAVRPGPVLPDTGCGSVVVNQDYNGLDSLIYTPEDGCPIIGANIYAFTKTVFDEDGVDTNRALAVSKTTTRVNGRWTESMKLNPGQYVLLYEKLGEYGPDTVEINVTPPPAPASAPSLPATKAKPARSGVIPTQAKTKDNGFFDI